MTFTETVKISRDVYERVNRLLALSSLEEMTDEELREAGANTNEWTGIFGVTFEDGAYLSYDLCSGSHNYYDDVVWSKDNEDVVPECMYELDDFSLTVNGNEYVVKLQIE